MASRTRTPEVTCCSTSCYRYVMLFFSFISIVCGSLFVLLSVYLFLFKGYLVPLLHNDIYIYCIYLMAGLGCLILFTAFISCSAAGNRCITIIYSILLCLILCLELVLVLGSLHYSESFKSETENHFYDDVTVNYVVKKDIQWAVDKLQIEGKCCGANSFEDFPKNFTFDSEEVDEEFYRTGRRKLRPQYVPDSCCRDYRPTCGKRDHPSNIYYNGCLSVLQREMQENMYFMCSASLAFFIIQLIASIVSCCVCCRWEEDDDMRHPFKDRDQELALFD